ncbi:MAG TPA: ester cyclase [Streptosporangiales bacterium]
MTERPALGRERAMGGAGTTYEAAIERYNAGDVDGFADAHRAPLVMRGGTSLQPTGRRVQLKGMELAHVRDGKIAEYHMYWDGTAIAEQLGLTPAPS